MKRRRLKTGTQQDVSGVLIELKDPARDTSSSQRSIEAPITENAIKMKNEDSNDLWTTSKSNTAACRVSMVAHVVVNYAKVVSGTSRPRDCEDGLDQEVVKSRRVKTGIKRGLSRVVSDLRNPARDTSSSQRSIEAPTTVDAIKMKNEDSNNLWTTSESNTAACRVSMVAHMVVNCVKKETKRVRWWDKLKPQINEKKDPVGVAKRKKRKVQVHKMIKSSNSQPSISRWLVETERSAPTQCPPAHRVPGEAVVDRDSVASDSFVAMNCDLNKIQDTTMLELQQLNNVLHCYRSKDITGMEGDRRSTVEKDVAGGASGLSNEEVVIAGSARDENGELENGA